MYNDKNNERLEIMKEKKESKIKDIKREILEGKTLDGKKSNGRANNGRFISGVDGEKINGKVIESGLCIMDKYSDSIKIRELADKFKKHFKNTYGLDYDSVENIVAKKDSEANSVNMSFEEICHQISRYIKVNGISQEIFCKMMRMQLELNEIKKGQ